MWRFQFWNIRCRCNTPSLLFHVPLLSLPSPPPMFLSPPLSPISMFLSPPSPLSPLPPQQWRLLPYLSSVFVISHFVKTLMEDFVAFYTASIIGEKSQRQAELGREMHALSCACKPLAGFTSRDGIQECREACGGHGYLAGTCGGHMTCMWGSHDMCMHVGTWLHL